MQRYVHSDKLSKAVALNGNLLPSNQRVNEGFRSELLGLTTTISRLAPDQRVPSFKISLKVLLNFLTFGEIIKEQ